MNVLSVIAVKWKPFFHRFVQKVFKLDPQTSGVPWQPRAYVSKRKAAEMVGFFLNMALL